MRRRPRGQVRGEGGSAHQRGQVGHQGAQLGGRGGRGKVQEDHAGQVGVLGGHAQEEIPLYN